MNDTTSVQTPDGIELEMELAGVASRSIAGILDLILLFGVWAILFLVFFYQTDLFAETMASSFALAFLGLCMFISYWGYGVFWELLLRGQTPGKKAIGIRVISQDGLPASNKKIALRNLLRAVDMQPGISYGFGLISLLKDQDGRRLGDIAAGTLVIKDSLSGKKVTQAGAKWAARAEKGQSQEAVRLPGGTLSARQLAMVEQFMERRDALETDRRTLLAQKMTEAFQDVLGDELEKLALTDPEKVLQKIQVLATTSDDVPNLPSSSQPRKSLF